MYDIRSVTRSIALLSLLFAISCSDRGETDPAPDLSTMGDMSTERDVNPPDETGRDASNADVGDMPADGIRIEGLSDEVTVYFDEHGVMHAQCPTDNDCYAALGYFHAAHRFVQMDIARRVARARAATLVPLPPLVELDATNRALMSTPDGTPLEDVVWGRLGDRVREAVTAYTHGVNAWLDDLRNGRNEARLSDEYDFPLLQAHTPTNIPDWEVKDSVAMGNYHLLTRSSFQRELRMTNTAAHLSSDVAFDLLGPTPVTPLNPYAVAGIASTLLLPGDTRAEMEDIVARLRPARRALREAVGRVEPVTQAMKMFGPVGSNNWAIGSAKSATGHAMFASEGHSPLTNPAMFYLAELDSVSTGDGELHVMGLSVPGLPIINGRTQSTTWANTNSFMDLSDIYIETLTADGTAVLFDGEEVPLVERDYAVEKLNGGQETRTLRFVPHHGPVIAYDPDEGVAISLRWVGHDVLGDESFALTEFAARLELMTARNVEEMLTAVSRIQLGNGCYGMIDADDNIALHAASVVPDRSQFPPGTPLWLALPGDGAAEWAGYVDPAEMVLIENPPSAIATSSNQDLTGSLADGDPSNDVRAPLQTLPIQPFRHQRLVDLLTAQNEHTPETMAAVQGDTYSIIAEFVLPEILQTAGELSLSSSSGELVGRLQSWERTCPTGMAGVNADTPIDPDPVATRESIGCTVFHTLLFELLDAAFGDELSEGPIDPSNLNVLRSLVFLLDSPERLLNGETYWDDVRTGTTETREQVLTAVLEGLPAELEERFGADEDGWRWGAIHRLVLEAPLFSDLVDTFNNGSYPMLGAFEGVQNHDPRDWYSGEYTTSYGPTHRRIVQNTDDGLEVMWQHPGGQRHFEDSAYYDNWLPNYLQNENVKLPFGADEYEAAAVEVVTLRPL